MGATLIRFLRDLGWFLASAVLILVGLVFGVWFFLC